MRIVFLAAALFLIVFAWYHQNQSELALLGEAAPLWNFSWRTSWQTYALGIPFFFCLSTACMPAFRMHSGAVFALSLLLGTLHLGDLAFNNCEKVPFTSNRLDRPLFLASVPKVPERVWMTPDLEKTLLDSASNPTMLKEFQSWVCAAGYPNTNVMRGLYQLNDYNPPFLHPALNDWFVRLVTASSPAILENLTRLSGIRFPITSASLAPGPAWKKLNADTIPANGGQITLWDAPGARLATLFTRKAIDELDAGKVPEPLSQDPVPVAWEAATCRLDISHLPLATDSVLFLPWAPFQGWTARVDGVPTPFLRRNSSHFGLALSVMPGAKEVVCTYHQPLLEHALFMVFLGLFGLLSLGTFFRMPKS